MAKSEHCVYDSLIGKNWHLIVEIASRSSITLKHAYKTNP